MVVGSLRISLAGGRTLSYDDVGDARGVPVVYLHGTPDSRLARHPDDGIPRRAGIRLLAVDRPGYGGTSPTIPDARAVAGAGSDAAGIAADQAGATRPTTDRPSPGDTSPPTPGADRFPADLVALLDALEIPEAALLAWSGGSLDALRAAAAPGVDARVTGVWLVGGLVPCDAYADPSVRAAASGRLELQDLARSLPPVAVAEAVAPLLAPCPCDLALARDHQREQRHRADQEALEQVPGAVERMAEALVEAVREGLAGVRTDIQAQVEPFGDQVLGQVTVPVRLLYGAADLVTPPAFGAWFVQHLPHATLEIIEGAGHFLPFTHWPRILASIAALH